MEFLCRIPAHPGMTAASIINVFSVRDHLWVRSSEPFIGGARIFEMRDDQGQHMKTPKKGDLLSDGPSRKVEIVEVFVGWCQRNSVDFYGPVKKID